MAEPNAESVREELAKIVASPPFNRGEKLCRFLRYVVEETLAERPENLKEYNIGVVVYERRADYETRVDSTVRVEASRLRTKLIEYYAGPGAESAVRIELPKGSYVPRFVAVKQKEAPSRRGWLIGAGAGVGVFGLAGLWIVNRQRGGGLRVLLAPMAALDGNAEGARRLTAELLTEIPRRTGWAVTEMSETTEAAIRERARSSGAAYLVTGSVRGGHAMVTLRTAEAGYKLWSRMFPVTGAGAIAEAMRNPGPASPGPGTANAEAAREYLEGHRKLSAIELRTTKPKEWPANLAQSLPHFERAVQLDGNFAAAWAAIATTLEAAAEWADDRAVVEQRAKRAAVRALELDETIAEAHAVLGSLAFYREWDVKEAVFRYGRAVELNPRNADLQRSYASALGLQGRHEEAAVEIGRAELSAPDVSPMSSGLAEVYFLARRHSEARTQARRAIALSKENAFAHWLLAVNSQLDGDLEEAEREYQWCLRKYALDSRALTGLAHLRAVQGRGKEGLAILEGAMRKWGSERGWSCGLAMVKWAMGDREGARVALRRGAEFREGSALFVLVDPRYDGMRETAEYRAIAGMVKR